MLSLRHSCCFYQPTVLSSRNGNVDVRWQQSPLRSSWQHSDANSDELDDTTRTPITSSSSTTTTTTSFEVQVMYEGKSCNIMVDTNETILSALERNQVSNKLGFSSSMVPSSCRRGNCLTCTASIIISDDSLRQQVNVDTSNSQQRQQKQQSSSCVITKEDGLTPNTSKILQEKGYILTCSSHVTGPGLQLRLGENDNVWQELYQTRLENDHARILGWSAMARTKRKSDERNIPRWKQETESVLQNDNINKD